MEYRNKTTNGYQFRKERNGRWIQVNTAGDLCVCHYTGKLFPFEDGIVLGAVLPQVKISYWCCKDGAESARKKSIKAFQEVEQNCNTCRHLERVQFNKQDIRWRQTGLQPGICNHPSPSPLYPDGGNSILFAPDDCMLQPCYEGRSP